MADSLIKDTLKHWLTVRLVTITIKSRLTFIQLESVGLGESLWHASLPLLRLPKTGLKSLPFTMPTVVVCKTDVVYLELHATPSTFEMYIAENLGNLSTLALSCS